TIETHAALAGAVSCSGLVRPSGGSAREAQFTSSGPNAPLPTPSIRPAPSMSVPVQDTFAVRSVAISSPPRSALERCLDVDAHARVAQERRERAPAVCPPERGGKRLFRQVRDPRLHLEQRVHDQVAAA